MSLFDCISLIFYNIQLIVTRVCILDSEVFIGGFNYVTEVFFFGKQWRKLKISHPYRLSEVLPNQLQINIHPITTNTKHSWNQHITVSDTSAWSKMNVFVSVLDNLHIPRSFSFEISSVRSVIIQKTLKQQQYYLFIIITIQPLG